ncbi:MAG: flippase [bacterium]|nr:MAG: flippase [bacterium]
MQTGRFRINAALKEIIINAGWLFFLRVLRILLALFVGVWVARYLGPARFGTLNYALAFVALFIPLARLGIDHIAVRDVVRRPEETDLTLGSVFILRLVGGIASLLLIVFTIRLVRPDDRLTQLMAAIVGFGLIFQAFDAIDIWFQSRVQSKYVVYARSSGLFLANLLKIVLILTGASLVAFAWISALDMIATAAALVIVYRARGFFITRWRFGLRRGLELLGQSWPLILSGALAVVYLKIDIVMLGQMKGIETVGIYSTAARISEVWYFIPVAISVSVFPALVKGRSLGARVYRRRLQQLYDFLVWIALLLAVALTFFAGPLIQLLYGEAYAGAGQILAIHIWAGIFVFMREAFVRWLTNEGLLHYFLITNGVGAGLNVVLNLFLIPAYGGTGAAVATVISYGAGGYLACFITPKTRDAGRMMSRALIVPLRAVTGWLGLHEEDGDGAHDE